jgi:hypothetical protein
MFVDDDRFPKEESLFVMPKEVELILMRRVQVRAASRFP